LWIQVLAASPADLEAIEEIERLAGSSGRRGAGTVGGNRSGLLNRISDWRDAFPNGLLPWSKKDLLPVLSVLVALSGAFAALPPLISTFSDYFSLNRSSTVKNAIQRFSENDVKGGVEAVSTLLDQGKLDDALNALNTVSSRDKERPSINYLRGRLVMENIRRRKNPAYTIKDARRAFLTATEDEPRNPAYMTALGFSYYAEGDIEQADDTWSQVLNLSDRKEYPKDNSDLVMAKAGMALVYFKESEKEPENKSRAIKFREYVRANADLNNLPDWRWSEGAISDWKKLIVLKNNSSLPNEAQ
jgi:tetratricopeptide (TPR) repeat protein